MLKSVIISSLVSSLYTCTKSI